MPLTENKIYALKDETDYKHEGSSLYETYKNLSDFAKDGDEYRHRRSEMVNEFFVQLGAISPPEKAGVKGQFNIHEAKSGEFNGIECKTPPPEQFDRRPEEPTIYFKAIEENGKMPKEIVVIVHMPDGTVVYSGMEIDNLGYVKGSGNRVGAITTDESYNEAAAAKQGWFYDYVVDSTKSVSMEDVYKKSGSEKYYKKLYGKLKGTVEHSKSLYEIDKEKGAKQRTFEGVVAEYQESFAQRDVEEDAIVADTQAKLEEFEAERQIMLADIRRLISDYNKATDEIAAKDVIIETREESIANLKGRITQLQKENQALKQTPDLSYEALIFLNQHPDAGFPQFLAANEGLRKLIESKSLTQGRAMEIYKKVMLARMSTTAEDAVSTTTLSDHQLEAAQRRAYYKERTTAKPKAEEARPFNESGEIIRSQVPDKAMTDDVIAAQVMAENIGRRENRTVFNEEGVADPHRKLEREEAQKNLNLSLINERISSYLSGQKITERKLPFEAVADFISKDPDISVLVNEGVLSVADVEAIYRRVLGI